jgi:hypothetical protein
MTLAQLLDTMTSRELCLWRAKARIEEESYKKLKEKSVDEAFDRQTRDAMEDLKANGLAKQRKGLP